MLKPRASDVALFHDWCQGTGTDPARATWDQAAQFLLDCPTTPSDTRRRAAAALTACAGAGNPLHDPGQPEPTAPLARSGHGWLHLHEALDRIPVWGWPSGFTGRRDGLILIAADQGLTRPGIAALTVDDGDLSGDQVTLNGTPVEATPSPHACPACRVWLWVQALTAVLDSGRAGGIRAVTEGVVDRPDQHVCQVPRTHRPDPAPLAVAVDQHGWVADRPLNRASLSRIITARLSDRTPVLARDERAVPVARRDSVDEAPARWKRDRLDDLTDAEDELERRAEALQDRAADLLKHARASQKDVERLVDDAWS